MSCPECPDVDYAKTSPYAVTPTRGTPLSIGYDLTAISVFKKLSNRTTLYDTGIKVNPPCGYYVEILPRSSLSKTGYMLSNSVGVIDPDYTGNLLIALTKVDDSLPDLTFPFTRCQMVLRKAEFFNFHEVEESSLYNRELRGCDVRQREQNVRGDGGFGSTDARKSVTNSEVIDPSSSNEENPDARSSTR